MGTISVREGRVCIIKTEDLTSIKEGMEEIKKALIDCTQATACGEGNLDTFLFVDLSLFNIINSSIIGVFGSILMNPNIQMLGLCGVKPPVREILIRFGVLSDNDMESETMNERLNHNMHKVILFNSIEQGLISLSPA